MSPASGSTIPQRAKRRLVRASQTASRKFNSTGLEQAYQANYFELASRTEWLAEPPLASPRGGTANYSLLYILLNVLRDSAVSKVIEFGAGSSSRMISQWVAAGDRLSVHVEEDLVWLDRVLGDLNEVSLVHAPLKPANVAGRSIDWYDAERPEGKFQLISVDGPQAWSKSTRFNRLGMLSWIPEILDDEFVIVIDDASRPGEAVLAAEIAKALQEANIDARSATYDGADSQIVFATPGFAEALYL